MYIRVTPTPEFILPEQRAARAFALAVFCFCKKIFSAMWAKISVRYIKNHFVKTKRKFILLYKGCI